MAEKRYSVLNHFDFNLLDDQDFQEDSVREEIIVPILKWLGYGPTKPHKIIRSKRLLHPFVSIGSATKKIHIVPDYLLEVNNKYAWVLEAKSPKENILNTKHAEQAYSYAIHSEIRVPYFALCNGREFVLYHISKPKPVVHFDMLMLPSYWDNLVKLLGPRDVLNCDLRLSKDFGLHLKRLGFHEFPHLIFPDAPIAFIGHMENDHYTFGSGLKVDGGDSYVVSFDFNSEVMQQLRGKIPEKAFNILLQPLENEMRQVSFADAVYKVTVDCRVGDKLEENEDEIFLPLRINKILD
ncbi:MAG: type I restriction enzyme HsdR N-terminal domain-containing protein [Candidatus Scalindua sp.]|nr:type I restriction enzyme HsdR N-terminal domain-containing protein [Candidatus Scalindua sp.]